VLCACSGSGSDGNPGTGGASTTSSATTSPDTTSSGGSAASSASSTSASSGGAGGAGHGCAGHNYKLCEDFEGANDGDVPAGWIKRHPYSSDPNAAVQTEVGVASDQAHWGSKSLKSSSDKCAQTRAQKSLSGLGATAGTHWGRVFIRVKTPAPLTDPNCNCYYHETFVALGPSATDESRVVDTTESPAGDVFYLYNVPDDSFGKGTDTSYMYEDKWQCAEWYIDDQTDSYRFFLDGKEIITFENEAGAKIKQFSDISVGSICYILPLAPTNFTAWFDDLAIDDKRIGCN
jgi:hypothetical protein